MYVEYRKLCLGYMYIMDTRLITSRIQRNINNHLSFKSDTTLAVVQGWKIRRAFRAVKFSTDFSNFNSQ